jgi:hypothetical protein
MSRCETCRLRATYDRDPRSVLGRLWKWHTRWCPGWKGYIKSLKDKERNTVLERYR